MKPVNLLDVPFQYDATAVDEKARIRTVGAEQGQQIGQSSPFIDVAVKQDRKQRRYPMTKAMPIRALQAQTERDSYTSIRRGVILIKK